MSNVQLSDDSCPGIDPFQDDSELYNRKVEEFLAVLKSRYPNNHEAFLRPLAEKMASPYAPHDPNKETERPN